MTAETLANDNLNTPANDDVHPLHTADNGGHTVTLRDSVARGDVSVIPQP